MNLAIMTILQRVTKSGLSSVSNTQTKRAVLLSNYLSLLISFACLLLFAVIPQNHNLSGLRNTAIEVLIFLMPIALNRWSFTSVSRIYLCWFPPILIMGFMIQGMKEMEQVPVSSYDGLRFYLLALACIPYLIMDKSRMLLFVAGIIPGLICIMFCDFFLDQFGVGYETRGVTDSGYSFTPVRVFIAYVITAGSALSLNFIIAENDQVNQNLLAELAEKNKLIKNQAETEVHQLNKQLYANLQELNEREFVLNQSQRIAKIGSWEYRIENAFLFWSDEMYNIFGLDRSFDLKDPHLMQLMWGDQNDVLMDANVALLRTGKSYDLTLRTKTPLGYHKWVRVSAFPILENENAVGIRGICHDITYYKEAEELLRTGESNYRSLFEQASDFILVLDLQGKIVDVNESLCQEFGYQKRELIGTLVDQLIDPDQLKEMPIRYQELYHGDHILSDRLMVKKNGTHIEVQANVKKVQENKILVIARDVTKLKEVQKQIQLSEATFRSVFESSALGMAIVTLDGKWMRANRYLCSMVGYSEEEMLSFDFMAITHPDDREIGIEFLKKCLTGEIDSYKREKRYIDKSGEIIWVNVSVSLVRDNSGTALYFVSQIENITDKKKAEQEKDRARYLLNERIKELTTLSRVSQILQKENISTDTIFQETVEVLPLGWQYPEITSAQIKFDRKTYKTHNYAPSAQCLKSEFQTTLGLRGCVEVNYLDDRPLETEGPFMVEERNLIDMIAEMLRIFLNRLQGEEALNKSKATLRATINNTEVLIWSVDRAFNLMMFNEPFFQYLKTHYQVEPKIGQKVLPYPSELQQWWEQNYLKALAGEVITLEETRFGIDFQYSLSPIIEDDRITGVSVFADNVTARKAYDRELAEANKKIGELTLMALRSVMSPHFIFNVLNSIQFFIAKNDREKAINYLSTFSKLIRSILTHSVNNKIKLSEEIEMLKNYVQLEMVRFENKFNFVLELDRDTDIDGIEIPSLLIQPYVENAILHGLYNKQENGTLIVRVREEADQVIFEVEDDGIGRAAATRQRQQNFPGHKSMGIKLTEERLRLVNANQETAVEIIDLMDGGLPCGTKVRIRINC